MSKRKPAPQTTQQVSLFKAAIYVRVSTEDQAVEGYGLDVQLEQCQQYAKAFGLTIVHTFTDAGISGTKPASERPALAAAIQAAQAGEYNILIVPAIDRLARRAALLLNIWDELEQSGVAIVAIKERIDTTTAAGRLSRTMFAGVAEFERDSIVARTTAGRDQRGKVDGEKGGRVPLGYLRNLDGTISIDPDGAEIVRKIFSLKGQGLSLRNIADQLNAEGITTRRSSRYSGKWHASSVKCVLDNEPDYRGGKRGESAIAWERII